MESDWKSQWETMTIDELFELRELMQDVLSERLKAKKAEIERRLQILDQPSSGVGPTKSGRPLMSQVRRAAHYWRAERRLLDGSALVCNSAVRLRRIVSPL